VLSASSALNDLTLRQAFLLRILAIHAGMHDASAAAFDEYALIAALAEERLTRVKGQGGSVPWLAIDEVLGVAGWKRHEIDVIALTRGYHPTHHLRVSPPRQLRYAFERWSGRGRDQRDLSILSRRFGTADTLSLFHTKRFLRDNGFRPDTKIQFVNHHEAHALAALFYTDWSEALIYTSDGIGDNVSYSMRSLKQGKLECYYGDDRWYVQTLKETGIASAYAYATVACGFRMLRHEGKLTGLAAYGKPKLARELAACFRFNDNDGLIETDFRNWKAMEEKVLAICQGHDRETIAASIQTVAEDFTLQSVRWWLARTGARKLALAGGLFANVRLNRLLAETLPVDEVFIFPAMGDDGLSVGAALCFLHARDGTPAWLGRRHRLSDVYFGQNFDSRIDDTLAAAGMRRLSGAPVDIAVELIRAGKAGAIYAGRMEFGPRALGARSIIASPHDHAINDDLNKRLARSEFMPFAPYVLEEDAERVFEITDANRYAAHFMTITCAVKPEWKTRIPAVVHVDGTARPQIVRDEANPLFAGILRGFRDATGLPVLINTSFNVHEEPIVNRPEECVQALRDDRVDFVVTRQAVYVAG
jgi:carbamoyltransferase